ncbi:MAG: MoxR family ATPase, partial [Bacteroidota bacterium]
MAIKHYKTIETESKTEDYILHEALESAVEVALALGQPLLLTGEPGTGKTKLAHKVAADLASNGFLSKPLVFNTKTTSTARDLLYTYDAVAHFQAVNIKREESEKTAETADFIELQALGKAIAFSKTQEVDRSKIREDLPVQAQNSVVLIDEIDKAPRDFTNDILNEIEDYQFHIKELNYGLKKAKDKQVLIIMTSNSEKNLPDAFLRRCVFYHIPFPSKELLLEIAQKQLGGASKFTKTALEVLIKKFESIRDASVRKKPATAELIGWLRILALKDYMDKNEVEQNDLI